ncbi:hypothetical protein [Arthrobacter sp. AL12]|uniref:hypothetical protein n=1 Tax=Arthrobacter sp. AL12 TaxID=3042241 RepID=UPI00249AC5BE|nr:hypothetical protein [Arthrobacter sp. AL12]MDI3211750.1 hypothetical protein [Arthrobacter sp. AL12]
MNINQYQEARLNLSMFVTDMAHKRAHELGFSWVPAVDAPATYRELMTVFADSVQTRSALPVYSLYCDLSIFKNAETNMALRFWHDSLHIQTGLTFSLPDEHELALEHLRIMEVEGIKKHSMEWEMLRIDLLGQNYLRAMCKKFPDNQERFVRRCLEIGFDEGVLEEVRLLNAA